MARGSHRASFDARLLYWRAAVNAGGENGHEENRSRREALQARRSPRGPRRSRGNRADRDGGEGLRSPEGAHGTLPWRRIRRGLPAESQDRGRGDGEDARGSDRGDRQGGAHRKDRRRKDLREHSGAGGAYPDGRNQRGGRLAAASEVGGSEDPEKKLARLASILRFQQHQQRTASTLIFRGLAEGEDFVSLRQPPLYFPLQHRLSSGRAQTLSMDHADAAQSALEASAKKFREQRPGLLPVEPVQIDNILHDPVPPPQLAQHIAGEAGSQVGWLFPGLDRLIPGRGAGQTFEERVMSVEQRLNRDGRRRLGLGPHPRRGFEGCCIPNRVAKQGGFVVGKSATRAFAHGFVVGATPEAGRGAQRRPSRYFSASSSAGQPLLRPLAQSSVFAGTPRAGRGPQRIPSKYFSEPSAAMQRLPALVTACR